MHTHTLAFLHTGSLRTTTTSTRLSRPSSRLGGTQAHKDTRSLTHSFHQSTFNHPLTHSSTHTHRLLAQNDYFHQAVKTKLPSGGHTSTHGHSLIHSFHPSINMQSPTNSLTHNIHTQAPCAQRLLPPGCQDQAPVWGRVYTHTHTQSLTLDQSINPSITLSLTHSLIHPHTQAPCAQRLLPPGRQDQAPVWGQAAAARGAQGPGLPVRPDPVHLDL